MLKTLSNLFRCLTQGGSFSLFGKHLPKNEKIGLSAIKKFAEVFQYVRNNFGDADDIFDLAVKNHERKGDMQTKDLKVWLHLNVKNRWTGETCGKR